MALNIGYKVDRRMWGICMPAGLGCTTNTTSSRKRVDSIPQAEYNLSENAQASSKSSHGGLYLSSQHPNDFETDLTYYSVSDSRVLDRVILDP